MPGVLDVEIEVGHNSSMAQVRVLLADDHDVVRAGLRKALDCLPDFEIVGEVGNGLDLDRSLTRLIPDLLVLDISMPDFEPLPSVQKIKVNYPNLKILIVSAYSDDSYVVGLLQLGVNGYHMKDQPLSDLQLAAQRIMQGDRWISGSLVNRLASRKPAVSTAGAPWLTGRQRDLLRLLIQGLDNRTLAKELGISVKTVENHLTALYRVLGVDSRMKAFNYALRHPELFAVSGQETAGMPSREIALNLNVLLVDDNARFRSQLGRIIGKISPASMLYEAEDQAETSRVAEKVRLHIAFIDVVLKDEDGIQCANRLHTISPTTRVILMSAYPDHEFRRQAGSAGAIAFLDKKDLDIATVRQLLEDVLP